MHKKPFMASAAQAFLAKGLQAYMAGTFQTFLAYCHPPFLPAFCQDLGSNLVTAIPLAFQESM